jgi:hypothetical protein
MVTRSARWVAVLATSLALAGVGAAAAGASSTTTTSKSATKSIQSAYSALFNLSNKQTAPKLAVIEDGAALSPALSEALSSPLAAAAKGAKVDSVTMLKATQCTAAKVAAPCAKVVYDILAASGPALLKGSKGYAVNVGGTWLVAKPTVCSLFSLFYATENKTGTPPGC